MDCRSISLSRLARRMTTVCFRFSSARCFPKRCCSQIVATTRTGSGSLLANKEHGPTFHRNGIAKTRICFSPYLYRASDLVERFFNKTKQCRRVATRYDQLAANYLAFVKLASIRIWLRANESAPYMPYFVCTAPNIVELTNIGIGPLLMTVLIQSLAAAIHSIER